MENFIFGTVRDFYDVNERKTLNFSFSLKKLLFLSRVNFLFLFVFFGSPLGKTLWHYNHHNSVIPEVFIVCPANIYLFKVNNGNTRKRCES